MPRGRYDMPLAEEKAAYLEGIARFNAGEFFEAHETWEDAWNGTSGRRSDFYKGLIQMVVALEHYRRLNGLGARKVLTSASKIWAPMPDVYMGLDLRRVEKSMRNTLAEVLAAADGTPVQLDPGRFFRIDWLYDPFENPRTEADE